MQAEHLLTQTAGTRARVFMAINFATHDERKKHRRSRFTNVNLQEAPFCRFVQTFCGVLRLHRGLERSKATFE